MAQLFIPMLEREATREKSLFWDTQKRGMMEHIGNELLTNMQRFTSQVLFQLSFIKHCVLIRYICIIECM